MSALVFSRRAEEEGLVHALRAGATKACAKLYGRIVGFGLCYGGALYLGQGDYVRENGALVLRHNWKPKHEGHQPMPYICSARHAKRCRLILEKQLNLLKTQRDWDPKKLSGLTQVKDPGLLRRIGHVIRSAVGEVAEVLTAIKQRAWEATKHAKAKKRARRQAEQAARNAEHAAWKARHPEPSGSPDLLVKAIAHAAQAPAPLTQADYERRAQESRDALARYEAEMAGTTWDNTTPK